MIEVYSLLHENLQLIKIFYHINLVIQILNHVNADKFRTRLREIFGDSFGDVSFGVEMSLGNMGLG